METEKELYERIWKSGKYGQSASVVQAFTVLKTHEGPILDVGCGKGDLVNMLTSAGIMALGCDITLAGLAYKDKTRYREFPSYDIGYDDDTFKVVTSTDFLEHLPTEDVLKTLKEFKRVSKGINYHWICCRPDVMGAQYGAVLHKTVQPMSWWHSQFIEAGFEPSEFHLVEAR